MRVLIVEDDQALCSGLVEIIKRSGRHVDFVADGEQALEQLTRADVLVTDLRLPGMDGISLLKEIRKRQKYPEIIVMTAYGTIPSAVEAMRCGARAYLLKPFDPEELLLHLNEVEELLRLREASTRAGRGALIGSSEAMQRVYREIDMASVSNASVLISGETGTGKELAARAIHDLSPGAQSSFVAVNLGALPRDLVESELFGHEKGAFTNAQIKKKGRFLLAHEGTLFLDEIDSLPFELQPKLLRALETKEIWPLGAERPEKVDARILAATNTELEKLIEKGLFREDLYYRLNVLHVKMPSVKEHPEDIPQIVHALLERMNQESPNGKVDISPGALAQLMTMEWRGNVREMLNVLERAKARCGNLIQGGIKLDVEHLDPNPEVFPDLPFKKAKNVASEEWAKRAIRGALVRSEGNVSRAAKLLRMNKNSLFRLIKKYDIHRFQ